MRMPVLSFFLNTLIMFVAQTNDSRSAIFGKNDFLEVEQVHNIRVQALSEAVGAQVVSRMITTNKDGSLRFSVHTTLENEFKDAKLCKNFPFKTEPLVAGCAGTLITSQLLLTAGHCIQDFIFDQKNTSGLAWIFDYKTKNDFYNSESINPENIHYAKKIVDWAYMTDKSDVEGDQTTIDFAIVLLDRPRINIKPIEVDLSASSLPQRLMYLGFPFGWPMKFSSNGSIISHSSRIMSTNLDAFKGSSGSLVLDQDNEKAVGILSYTQSADFENSFDTDGSRCVATKRYLSDDDSILKTIKDSYGFKNDSRTYQGKLTNAFKIAQIPNLVRLMKQYP